MAYRTIGGEQLWYEVQGEGDPVLLLHGGFCSLEHLRTQGDALAASHEVHAFERSGHGRSADIAGEYSYERGVADALEYLDGAGLGGTALGAVDVVGFSDGAIIGLMLAMQHPGRVRSLVAISGNLDPSGFSHAEGATSAVMLDPLPAPAPADADADALTPDTERAHYEALSPDGPEHADVVLTKLFALWNAEPRISPGDLDRITARTLIMSGDRDSIRPDHSLLIASSIPGAQLAIVPGASHGLITEKPELVSAIIRDSLG